MNSDATSLILPSIVQPTKRVKDKPYLMMTFPLKLVKELGIDENTRLLIGIVPGTKSCIIQPIVDESSSNVSVPYSDIEINSGPQVPDDASRAGKISGSALILN